MLGRRDAARVGIIVPPWWELRVAHRTLELGERLADGAALPPYEPPGRP
jgi:hypothetical protein